MTDTTNQLAKILQNLVETYTTKNKQEEPEEQNVPANDTGFMGNLNNLNSLMKSGMLPAEQIQNIALEYLKHSLGLSENNAAQPAQTQPPAESNNTGSKYSEVFNYLKGTNSSLNQGDYDKLSQILDSITENAINQKMQQYEHEQKLTSKNSNDKSRLTANAQNSAYDSDQKKRFTREEIGKMSTKEFLQNEEAIMYQLRHNMIN